MRIGGWHSIEPKEARPQRRLSKSRKSRSSRQRKKRPARKLIIHDEINLMLSIRAGPQSGACGENLA